MGQSSSVIDALRAEPRRELSGGLGSEDAIGAALSGGTPERYSNIADSSYLLRSYMTREGGISPSNIVPALFGSGCKSAAL